MVYCTRCKKEFPLRYFCPECGIPIVPPFNVWLAKNVVRHLKKEPLTREKITEEIEKDLPNLPVAIKKPSNRWIPRLKSVLQDLEIMKVIKRPVSEGYRATIEEENKKRTKGLPVYYCFVKDLY